MLNIQDCEKGIIDNLPQIGYIIDQVGEAMKWLKEVSTEERYLEYLNKTLKVSEYTKKISQENFYKYHLVIASLLLGLNINPLSDTERFKIFDSPSKSVEKVIKTLLEDPELVKTRGCFKALTIHASNVAREDQDSFVILLVNILCDLETIKEGMNGDIKAPITKDDYISILGYAYTVLNLEISNLPLLNESLLLLNNIKILLNNLSY